VDIDKVKELVQLMVDHDLLSISLRDGSEEITLNRPGNSGPIQEAPAPQAYAAQVAPAPVPVDTKGPDANGDAAADADSGLIPVTSPMVGTFYSASTPDAPAFAQIGSVVSKDSVVCIIEAMKVFNEIRAEVSGTVEKVLASNEQAVEYGQPLFMVRPN
jgi:acetyl-CoA carboxylase biotin carboxyl carrier protein